MVKMNGAEFKRFYSDESIWGTEAGEVWHDDMIISVNGVEDIDGTMELMEVKDADTIKISGGYITYAKKGDEDRSVDLESTIRKWRKKQNMTLVVVDVPNVRLTEFLGFLEAQNFKVHK